jgi:uncharacterized membrane protein
MTPEQARQLEILQARINNLQATLGRIQQQVVLLQNDMTLLRRDIINRQAPLEPSKPQAFASELDAQPTAFEMASKRVEALKQTEERVETPIAPPKEDTQAPPPQDFAPSPTTQDWENYLGGNILGKIGMFLLLIGMGTLISYAVTNNLISPMMRVALSYVAGMVLVGVAYRLEKNYSNYAALLLGGGCSLLYFTTYLGYSFEILTLPPGVIFAMLVLVSVFATGAAIRMNHELVALLGIVGAYVVPILLGNSANQGMHLFFGYMALLNGAVLWLALYKRWQVLSYFAFLFTWGAFLIWYTTANQNDWYTAAVFSTVFFLLFYGVWVSQAWQAPKEESQRFWVLLNAGLYFALGLTIFSTNYADTTSVWSDQWLIVLVAWLWDVSDVYRGLFALANGLMHTAVLAVLWFRQYQNDQTGTHRELNKTIFLLAFSGITVAIPLLFQGRITAIFWAIESCALLVLAGRGLSPLFRIAANFALLIALLSTLFNWLEYTDNTLLRPVFNSVFVSSVFVVAVLGFWVYWLNRPEMEENTSHISRSLLLLTLLLTVYVLGLLEWHNSLYWVAKYGVQGYENAVFWSYYWLLGATIYTALFLTMMLLIGMNHLQADFTQWAIQLSSIVLPIGGVLGVITTQNLLNSYYEAMVLDKELLPGLLFARIGFYAAYLLLIAAALRLTQKQWPLFKSSHNTLVFLTHVWVLCFLSCEVRALAYAQIVQSPINSLKMLYSKLEFVYGTGYTILWGAYAVGLMTFGIWSRQRTLRLTGMAFVGLVLLKIFTVDIIRMETLARIITFLILSVLFLVTAFLYQKYKELILATDEPEDAPNNPTETTDSF